MEKFGVDEGVDQEKLEKQAAHGCPKCGSDKVTRHGTVLVCEHCGSEPWEEENKKR
jgi:ribosomal protein L37AE/L43A